MPDGSVRFDGEAVAEVLRNMPNAQWFAWTFALRILGVRPFQGLLNVAYTILADTRPLFGCESCGMPSPWVKPIARMVNSAKALFGKPSKPHPSPHFSRLRAAGSTRRSEAPGRSVRVQGPEDSALRPLKQRVHQDSRT